MGDDIISFDGLVEECVRDIYRQVSSERGVRASHAVCQYLAAKPGHELARIIANATNPAVKQLLLNEQELGTNILSLLASMGHQKQGVYADILTNDTDQSSLKLYIGGAAGPYKPRSAGFRDRIRWHEASARSGRVVTGSHHRALQEGWHAHWTILVAFPTCVDKELVQIAQAVMVIFFGSCPRSSYLACRPACLPTVPNWGLNEIGPLGEGGFASYNNWRENIDLEEVDIIRRRLSSSGVASTSSKSTRHQDRLRKGGLIHVNVLRLGGDIKRFFITPMTEGDGAHIDITIPLFVGLKYGLQVSRQVYMQVEFGDTNHHTPYAARSKYNSNARRLGILISGTCAVGNRKGSSFSHWIQSTRGAAVGQAEKILHFLLSNNVITSERRGGDANISNCVIWSDGTFLTVPESTGVRLVSQPSSGIPQAQPAEEATGFNRREQEIFQLLSRLIRKVYQHVLSRKLRAIPPIRSYMKANSAESVATAIAKAIRPSVLDLILSTEQFTTARLLSVGGDIRDQSQGIYADIITYRNSDDFKIYVGAATAVASGHRAAGLRRRIQEHLTHAKLQKIRLSKSTPHANEILDPNACMNFVVLVRFPSPVLAPLVHIAEAVMTILFATLENHTFLSLRPRHLAEPGRWGLNEASPLDYSIVSDSAVAQARRSQNSRKVAARERDRMIAAACEGCKVRVTRANLHGKPRGFRFNFCGERITIPASLATSLDLHIEPSVKVVFDVREGRHPYVYAERAKWGHNGERLGICLKGQYHRGPLKDQSYEKWIQCTSDVAVMRAERIIGLLGHRSIKSKFKVH